MCLVLNLELTFDSLPPEERHGRAALHSLESKEADIKVFKHAQNNANDITRLGFFGSEDAAQALSLLAAGPCVTGDLDQHICLRNVNGVVPHLGQEHSVDLNQENHS